MPYQTKAYEPLLKLGECVYSGKTKKYTWTFPIINIREVLAVLGKPININSEDAELVNTYADKKGKKVDLDKVKGKGFIHVTLHPTKPNYFIVTTVREKQPQNTLVSFPTVLALWWVIKKQPANKLVLTATVAKNYCAQLGITGFNTYEGNRFNWKYFSGSRKFYLVFYAAIKVLVHYGIVSHVVQASRSGIVRRADTWDLQTELRVIDYGD